MSSRTLLSFGVCVCVCVCVCVYIYTYIYIYMYEISPYFVCVLFWVKIRYRRCSQKSYHVIVIIAKLCAANRPLLRVVNDCLSVRFTVSVRCGYNYTWWYWELSFFQTSGGNVVLLLRTVYINEITFTPVPCNSVIFWKFKKKHPWKSLCSASLNTVFAIFLYNELGRRTERTEIAFKFMSGFYLLFQIRLVLSSRPVWLEISLPLISYCVFWLEDRWPDTLARMEWTDMYGDFWHTNWLEVTRLWCELGCGHVNWSFGRLGSVTRLYYSGAEFLCYCTRTYLYYSPF